MKTKILNTALMVFVAALIVAVVIDLCLALYHN